MLPRVLEPEVMDSPAEANDYDTMDHSAVNRVFVDDFLASWNGTGIVLDVGTGTAQIPIELCRRRNDVHLVAIDLAEHMLRVGQDNVSRAGLAERVHLERFDAKQMPYRTGTFSAVISNSIVHHVPEPGAVLAEMVRVAGPGSLLFVRDLLRPADDGAVAQLVRLHAAGANPHQQQMFEDSLRAALTLDEVRALVVAMGLDPATVAQTTDRHWTWMVST
jgi:ubiquinone/menaquinone biosynthesis C-methylase UbiE